MGATFSLVYPTRHRPEFIAQALQMLEEQEHDSYEVVVCDNWVDPDLSCEAICREARLPALRYVHPPNPLGMVDNWRYALGFATGEYVTFLTDKTFVLPGALRRVEQAVEAVGGPDIVSWSSNAYNPSSSNDFFADGTYVAIEPVFGPEPFRTYAPREELDHRGEAAVSRREQSSADYSRGKLAFGAYRRDLVERILARFGPLFHNINPDYTSMILGLSEATSAVEMASSCVVSVNAGVSNGMQTEANDALMLAFYESLTGGAEAILPNLLVPGVYASQHNGVAHDYLAMKRGFDLPFHFNEVNWLTYCWEDIYRPDRQWSDPLVEADQKQRLAAYLETLGSAVAQAVADRVAARAVRVRPSAGRRALRRIRRMATRTDQPTPVTTSSVLAAVRQATANGR